MNEHRTIWLQPHCVSDSNEDRLWCQDDVWGECDECGTKSVKYIIATEHDALVKALQFIADGYDNQDVNHVDFRVKAYQVAIEVLELVGCLPDERNGK